MSLFNTSTSYGSVAKFFHWLIGILVIVMLSVGFFLDDVPEDYKGMAYNLHKVTGITILFLMLLRLFWAVMNKKPRLPGTPILEKLAEHIVHYSLYFFVMLMPLAGWIGSVAGGRPPHIGNFLFNLPIAPSKELATSAFEIHGWAAWILIVLVSVHALAAFYHHFVRKDAVLTRMLPGS